MDDDEPLASRVQLPEVAGDGLSRLLRGDDPTLAATIASLVKLVRSRPEQTLAGFNNIVNGSDS